MAFDFKKEYKELYQPATAPSIVQVPSMNYIAVKGKGDPNAEGSEYKRSIEMLYGIAYTLKMSKMGSHKMEGYFDYVVPPLEGLWWTEAGVFDYSDKQAFNFISMIRLPDFVQPTDVDWAKDEATRKKKANYQAVEFFTYDEGLCVQCMHIGPYDNEPATISAMERFAASKGYLIDLVERLHHEIYLSDPRKTAPEKTKTVIRIPVKTVLTPNATIWKAEGK
jgi:hypothetical protein